MIVTRVDGRLRVVTQVAHQEQCGLLMRAWGSTAFACLQPWDPVVAAAAVHDEGWREWEQHPGVLLPLPPSLVVHGGGGHHRVPRLEAGERRAAPCPHEQAALLLVGHLGDHPQAAVHPGHDHAPAACTAAPTIPARF